MTEQDHELLGQFTREGSQDAFTALVNRHLSLVYSAAVRQARRTDLAEDIALAVFTQLARNAAELAPDTILSAWLYKVTCNMAVDFIRREARRQEREQIAFQMSALNETPADWSHVERLLDEAMQSLDDTDRAAILLRYFENKSLREVGAALGASEDAAQKRVCRALERLRSFFSRHKLEIGTASLAALLSPSAVHSAPAGLAGSIASSALLNATATSTLTAVTITKAIAMTTLQKSILGIAFAAAIASGLYQARQASTLRAELQAQRDQQSAERQALRTQRDAATNSIAALTAENNALTKRPSEVMKLRGEVGRLKQENVQMGSTSALSKVTADPATRKLMYEQQKMGVGIIYKGLADKLNLTTNQSDKLTGLLADHIMTNVDNVTTFLRDKPSADQMDQIFNAEEAAVRQGIADLLGPDAAAAYKDFNQNILATLTAEQFKTMMTGTDAEKTQKAGQIAQAIEEQSKAVLAANNLPADYQTVPILNFRNIVSEQTADQNIQLMTDIYQRAAAQYGSFLTPDEITKFQQFETTAADNSRAALKLNRNLMAPISQ